MKYIFKNWEKINGKLKNKFVVIFIDFDGTLSPIVKEHEKAFLPEETKKILHILSKSSRCAIIVISGRDLKNVKKKVGIKGITYAGNHGFQIEGPKVKLNKSVSQKYKNILRKIKNDLTMRISGIKGAFIEDKGLSLSLHYRMVNEKKVPLVKKSFYEATNYYLTDGDIEIKRGKKLLEVRPTVDWNKGSSALWLLSARKFISKDDKILPIYIGDDTTDEDAFRMLRGKGITIFVGKSNRKSYAKYYLKNTDEVRRFLVKAEEVLKVR